MKTNTSYIREYLKRYRKVNKIKAKSVANAVGLSPSAFSMKERGMAKFSLEELDLYANYLGYEITLSVIDPEK